MIQKNFSTHIYGVYKKFTLNAHTQIGLKKKMEKAVGKKQTNHTKNNTKLWTG